MLAYAIEYVRKFIIRSRNIRTRNKRIAWAKTYADMEYDSNRHTKFARKNLWATTNIFGECVVKNMKGSNWINTG